MKANLRILLSVFVMGFGVTTFAKEKLPAKKVESQTTPVQAVTTSDNATTAPEYKFNSAGAPSKEDDRPELKFKAPVDETAKDTTMANPVENIKNDQPYVTYIGYPRWKLTPSWSPVSTGFKQNYNGFPLNFSSTSTASVDLDAKIVINPEMYFDIDYNHSEFSVKSKSFGIYNIQESTAQIDTLEAGAYICQVQGHSAHKWCEGVILGLDAYPSLDFATNNDISLNPIKDTTLGLAVNYSYPMMHSANFLFGAGIYQGLKIGQNSNLEVKNNNKYNVRTGFEFTRENLDNVKALIGYDARSAAAEGKPGSTVDRWTTNSTSVSLMLGYEWTLQTK